MKKPDITPGKYLASDDEAIAALPDLLEALEVAYKAMTATAWTMENNHDARSMLKKADQVQAALTKAGYTFE